MAEIITTTGRGPTTGPSSRQYLEHKARLHRALIARLEADGLSIDDWTESRLRQWISSEIQGAVARERLAVNSSEIRQLAEDVYHELVGFGPLQSLIDDPGVDDVVVNGPHRVFVERDGKLEEANARFANDDHVLRIIRRILAPIGRRIDESTPMVDARLPDGSRVNAVIPPIALDGPSISIRKFRAQPLKVDDLVRYGSLSRELATFLQEAVAKRTSMIVVGGTGTGKTTILNMLSRWISTRERVITIEDAAELRLEHPHVVRLETRPPNLEGDGEITARDLVRNALRMRPDRIVLGEVRSDEVLDMLQAMNTGHEGSMTTLHANSTRDAIHRIELLAGFAGYQGDTRNLHRQIASAVQMLVQLQRLPSGARRVAGVSAIRLENDTLHLDEVFRFNTERGCHEDLRA
ncbi:MAG: CpaF family protein [Oceanococcaceae bacterium]